MKNSIFVFSFLICSLFTSLSFASFQSEECEKFKVSLPASAIQGFLSVPEDWDHPAGKQIPIFYVAMRLRELPNKTPVVYFNGGPGMNFHGNFNGKMEGAPESKSIPIIYIDQRGLGCSGVLPNVPFTLDGAKTMALYGTRGIVRDAEAVRKKLLGPDRKWRAFGASYGGAIVYRYVQMYPKSLEAAFAATSSLLKDGNIWVEQRILAQKKLGDLYLQKYPEDKSILAKAGNQIPSDHCQMTPFSKICGRPIFDGLFMTLAFKAKWDEMHQHIVALLDTSGTLSVAELNKLEKFSDLVYESDDLQFQALGDFLAAVVPGRELPGGLGARKACLEVMDRLRKTGSAPGTWFVNECRMAIATTQLSDSFIDQIWQKDYLEPKLVLKSLQRNPKLKLFVYSGGLDSFTPASTFSEEVNLWGNRVKYTNFEDAGHEAPNRHEVWLDLAADF